jgi:hypothetical protein
VAVFAEDTLRICSDPSASIVFVTGPRLTAVGTTSPMKDYSYRPGN